MSIPPIGQAALEHVEARLRVRYAETDQMGMVYHANYLVWMEVGRVEYCRASGVRYRDLEQEGILLAVVEAHCRYLSPALYDEEVVVRTEHRRGHAAAGPLRLPHQLRRGRPPAGRRIHQARLLRPRPQSPQTAGEISCFVWSQTGLQSSNGSELN